MSTSLSALPWRPIQRHLLSTGLLILSALVPMTVLVRSTSAVQLSDGRTAFDSSLRLIGASSSFSSRNIPSTYYFTLKIPENAGEPLKAVKIVQQQNLETISYRDSTIRAFKGNRWARSAQLPLAAIGGRMEPGEMEIVFDPPVQPGNTVTVSVKAKRNPLYGGIYQFGVTAYPAGEKSIGQSLGFTRLNFYND